MIKNVAIFASGSGSNAENIIKYFKGRNTLRFPLILSDKEDAYVHERAGRLGVSSYTFPKEDFVTGEKIMDFLRKNEIDAIVLAGFLRKIPTILVEAYPDKIINIHPALLPKYGGKGMYGDRVHRAVAEAREKETGITIHYVNEHYDEGNIIFQAKCALTSHDTPEQIAEKVHILEYEHFPKVIKELWEAPSPAP